MSTQLLHVNWFLQFSFLKVSISENLDQGTNKNVYNTDALVFTKSLTFGTANQILA